MAKRICIGAFAGAHGIHGDFKLKSFTADPADIASYGLVEINQGDLTITLTLKREQKPALFIATAPEIKTREQAEALKGKKIFVPRDRLPPTEEDEFYYEDLVGLAVQDLTGNKIGKVKAVLNHGADDILEVTLDNKSGHGALFPFTREVVPVVNLSEGHIVLDPPAEIVAEADPTKA